VFARAVFAFLAMPGVVAFAVPISWLSATGHTQVVHLWGIGVLAAGVVGLAWTVRDFYVAGKGTLAPWAPPRRLVVVGLYRWSRNPMYLAVLTILAGWAIAFAMPQLGVYAAALAVAFHLRVVLGEEKWLAATHGEEWKAYAAHVRRWF
jgi:protein-S-isoprenylcysteine O-methyltransferase Ste14